MAFEVVIPSRCPMCNADRSTTVRGDGWCNTSFACGAVWESEKGTVLESADCLRGQIAQLNLRAKRQAIALEGVNCFITSLRVLCQDGIVCWSLATKNRMYAVEAMLEQVSISINEATGHYQPEGLNACPKDQEGPAT